MDFAAVFAEALPYNSFLDRYASADQRSLWDRMRGRAELTEQQRATLKKFRRRMQVLVMAGAWCGDCIEQCPLFEAIAEAAPLGIIDIRYIDRDARDDVKAALTVCGGARVPAVVFLNEDGQFCGRAGDRTLSKYRQLIAESAGESCPTGLGPASDLLAEVTREWFEEFERIQWMLCTSPRLRARHGD